MRQLPTLMSERLLLRPFHLSDATRVKQLVGCKDVVATTLNIPHPYADGLAEAWISSHTERFRTDRSLDLAICLRESDVLVGAIGLLLDLPNSNASLGYWLGKDYWHKGYCTEAAKVLIHYGFEEFDLHRIYATHLSHSPASGRVMEKLGMKREGILRDHALKWGRLYDLIYYIGILKSEYVAQRAD